MAGVRDSNRDLLVSDEVSIADQITGVESEDTTSSEKITEPFDPTQIRVETKAPTIDQLLSRIRNHELELTPDFQRKGDIWKDDAKSRLIESILIRIPLPAFYMDATDDDKWIVIDGLQRLISLKRFVIDKNLRLCGLEFLRQLQDKAYDELPRNFQRRIAETQVTVYLIEKGTPPDVKFNIFKRINTGGLPLSAQEIRHALNQGEATRFLAQLASSTEFKKATDNSIRDERMADREFVLRFLAFTITPYTEYKGKDFDHFLNDAMATLNKMPDQKLDSLKRQFLRAMNAAYELFGNDAFRKRLRKSDGRYPISKSLFETWSVNIGRLEDFQLERLKERKDLLQEQFIHLMNADIEFVSAITQGTGDINKVRRRFSAIEKLIKEVLS